MNPFTISVIGWAAALVLFLIVEAATAGLSSIWFALGALCALLCALLKGPLWLQVVLFLVVSVVTLVLTRPLAKKYVNARRQPTNADRNIGRTAVVTEEINELSGTGAVRLDGQEWSARTLSGAVVPVGAHVIVREIRGVKLLVESES